MTEIQQRARESVGELTRREQQVLDLISQGMANPAICRELWISKKTLERHVANIYAKLQLPQGDVVDRRVAAATAWLAVAA